jgi:tRNA dimethylallyltransferase
MKPVLHVLTGCTAVGKTDWALRWAEEHAAEIVSCDSLLFYRGMTIGTAKPTAAELERVPHHLIDVLDVTGRMDVTQYVARVRAALAEIGRRGRRVLVVGGSGFYLKAFFAPVADDEAVTPAEALARLRTLNPAGLGPLDPANPRRVSRALERCLVSGRTLAALTADFARQPPPFADWRVNATRIDRSPEELARRIEQRVEAMLRAGLVDEVRGLLRAGLKENPSASRAIGYRETIDYLEGRLTEPRLRTEIARNTRALVKKQRTWFRTQLPAHRTVDGATLRETNALFADGRR